MREQLLLANPLLRQYKEEYFKEYNNAYIKLWK